MANLTPEQEAILRKLQRGGEIAWYYGARGVRFDGLPRGAKTSDVQALFSAGLIRWELTGYIKLVQKES